MLPTRKVTVPIDNFTDNSNGSAPTTSAQRLAIFVGHHTGWILPGLSVLMAIRAAVIIWRPDGEYVLARSLIGVVLAGATLLAYAVREVHARNLCTRDLDSRQLTDPQGEITRNAARLRLFHDPRASRALVATGLAFVLFQSSAMLIGSWPFPARIVVTFAVLSVVFVGIYESRILRTHLRLRLWCPHCRHRDDVRGAAPDPTGSSRVV